MYNNIKCEVVKVNNETGVCPGVAKTQLGETYIIGGRTPDSTGICCQAFIAMSSMRHVMALTEKLEWETEDKNYYDSICPHGFVTYRLTRMI